MKTWLAVALGVAAAITLVVAALGVGWLLWGRRVWLPGTMGGPGMAWSAPRCDGVGNTASRGPAWRGPQMMHGQQGPGMMGGAQGWGYAGDCPAVVDSNTTPSGESFTTGDAQEAVEAYVRRLGYDQLEIAELMEFEHNYYAIVREHDTGIGAMELLVDKTTGAVGPEMGPNMMWNTRYGMHRRGGMMGRFNTPNTLSEEQAIEVAQLWLDSNRPGIAAEAHADPFYGYYTIHTEKDGAIEGMLSVHGTTGRVWYHTWHGAFIQMVEGEGEHE